MRTSKECRLGGLDAGDGMTMSTICGLPTIMKLTTLAVSSCDFLLDLRVKSSVVASSR